MQTIYEQNISEYRSVNNAKMNLMSSFHDMYVLYIRILTLFGALVRVSEQIFELKKLKHLPSTTDLQPNLKFINNIFIKKLSQNAFLQQFTFENNLKWNSTEDLLFVRKTYDALSNEDFFIEYMQSYDNSFETDKQLVLTILEKFMLENESMNFYFGEIKLNWLNDYNDVIIFVYSTLKSFTENQSDDKPLPSLFKTSKDDGSEELFFAQDLLTKTIRNDYQYEQIIAKKIQNWELDRVACIDFILLKMAICEFCEFPNIPLRVTLNEYIEIAKYYSTPKSRAFINGLLDNVLLYLKQENKINKQGRGLRG